MCGDCGGFYGQKVWHSTSKYRKVIGNAIISLKIRKKSVIPTLIAETIQMMFLNAYNTFMGDRAGYRDCELMRQALVILSLMKK